MTRRIIYILLAVVVVLVVVLGIRWWLNRDTGEATVAEDTTGVVEDMTAETPVEETAPEGDTGEASAPVEETTDTAVTEGTAPEGDQAAAGEGETAAPETSDTTTDATAPEGSGEGAQDGATTDSTIGGVADAGDPNAGGGMPAADDQADAVTSSDASSDATTTDAAGSGGQVAVVPPVATLVVPGQAVQHIVQNNEWLTQLARCYGTTVQDIQAANNYSCPDLIHAGWVVNITNPGNAGPITINEMPCFVYYTVQQGQNLYRIAEQHGIHFQWLARINAIYNYDYIQTGQVLVIPNPVPPELTTAPAQPFFYSNCWYGGCSQPQAVPSSW
jgi:LysM repeat protein